MDQALSLIYYTFQKAIQFLLNATVDSAGNVSVLYVFLAVFLFSILIHFLLAVPRTYHGRPDRAPKGDK